MTNINSTISAITLNIDGLEESIRKKKYFHSGSKNKTQLYVVCKKPTLNAKTHVKKKYKKVERYTLC